VTIFLAFQEVRKQRANFENSCLGCKSQTTFPNALVSN
jgi:hypothetical protein